MSPRLAGYGSYKSIRAGPLCNLGCICLQPAVAWSHYGDLNLNNTVTVTIMLIRLSVLPAIFSTAVPLPTALFDFVRPHNKQYTLDKKKKKNNASDRPEKQVGM